MTEKLQKEDPNIIFKSRKSVEGVEVSPMRRLKSSQGTRSSILK